MRSMNTNLRSSSDRSHSLRSVRTSAWSPWESPPRSPRHLHPRNSIGGNGMPQNANVIDADLLALLVCPVDHAALELKDSDLICTECGRSYPIVDGIPNMVVED